MLLQELLSGVDVVRLSAPRSFEVSSIVSDSRRATPGCLFLCLPGTRTDGHRYIGEAMARGASAVVIGEGEIPPDGIPYAVVRHPRIAAAHIWNNRWGDPTRDMRVVAITGTNGKTSTSYMLRAILKRAGIRCGLIGTVRSLCGDREIELGGGGEISDVPASMTTPDPEYLYGAAAEMRRMGVQVLIVEVSSHALAWNKVDAMRIDLGLFTNLSPEHLDYHGTMDAYLRAKARLFTLCSAGILNADDPYADSLASLAGNCAFIRCSAVKNGADVCAGQVHSQGMDGVEYIYRAKNTVFRLRCPIPGSFSVYNSLLAATAALRLGVDVVSVQEAMEHFSGVDGRMERIPLSGAPFTLFLDYAHTPAALESLLRCVRAARGQGERITLLFGCGGDRDPGKRPVMGRIASALADFVIVTADNSRSEDPQTIFHAILSGMDREKPHILIPDRREAIRYAIRSARAGDILLFAGKGHEKYEITPDGKLPFDEAELARTYWVQKCAENTAMSGDKNRSTDTERKSERK